MIKLDYGFSKKVPYNYEEALVKAADALKSEGFGILTEIDVKDTLKKKLNAELKPYKILGACNPPYAFKALKEEEQIGLMLPCNVIVFVNENDETIVSAIDPIASMSAVKNEKLGIIAEEIRNKLKNVIENI
ncbi:MAG: hypothetical protein HGGPFJEG_02111 [Ignavibacteria bacterium]|nr:hypothetical protein [Ignavibacteria bacterium]